MVGPRVASGLGLSLTRRDEKSMLSLKLDVSPPPWHFVARAFLRPMSHSMRVPMCSCLSEKQPDCRLFPMPHLVETQPDN